MNKFIRFFKMKKEQRLIRSFDQLLSKIKKSEVAWYPNHCLGVDDLEYQLSNSEKRVDDLIFEIGELKDQIKHLKFELDTYDLTNWL